MMKKIINNILNILAGITAIAIGVFLKRRLTKWLGIPVLVVALVVGGVLILKGSGDTPFAFAADSGFKSPTSTGEDHNDWSNPSNGFASDNSRATYQSATDRGDQDYYNFTFGVPAGATIDGIELSVEGKTSFSTLVPEFELSWDGGATYTTTGYSLSWTATESTQSVGGATDKWGRTWSDTELSDTNFRVRIDTRNLGSFVYQLDHIQAKVYYTASGGGGESDTQSIIWFDN